MCVVMRCECDNLSEYGCRNSVILAEMWDVREEDSPGQNLALIKTWAGLDFQGIPKTRGEVLYTCLLT
jgi:hypothetical protein